MSGRTLQLAAPDHPTTSVVSSIGLAMVAHSGFGLYVVFVKYLIGYLPSFRTLALAFSLAVPVVLIVTYRGISWHEFERWEMWLLAGLGVGRSITKLIGLQFTFAIYVQLVDMAVPLLTPVFAWLLLKERMPPGTPLAILATTLGTLCVITVNPLQMTLPNGPNDLIGIGFAFVSAIFMILGVVYTRHLTTRASRFRPAGLFVSQIALVAVGYWALAGFKGEPWQPFRDVGPSVWLVFGLFVALSIVAAGISQTVSISRIKATLFSALLSWRLAVAAVVGWLLLGETLSSGWQIAGVVLVKGTISLYLLRQARAGRSAVGQTPL
jgi:drug/metabolite transporter (DMT)-like permease